MAQTVANLATVLKDAWTSDRIKKQFYNLNPLLDYFGQVSATIIGQQAQVPIHKGRSGGYTSTGPAGGVLNPADAQKTDQAIYTMVYHWFQVAIETAAMNQSAGNAQSIISGKDLEMKGAIDDVSKQCSRQLASGGDGLIAQCTTTTASTTLNLMPPASGGAGYGAIVRGWVVPGQPVDIGTVADSDVVATAAQVVDVGEDPNTPTLTLAAPVTTGATHFVSIANPNSATATNPELNGFRNMVGSATSTLGGINPATAGEGYWKPAKVDTTTTTFSLDLALDLQRAVFQKGGDYQSAIVTGAKQNSNFYATLQNQVRFSGEMKLGAGGVGGLVGMSWNGLNVNVWPDILDTDWFMFSKDDIVKIVGDIKTPTWISDLEGAGGDLRWGQGTTAFSNAVVWPFQVGMQRRNRTAAAVGLTA